MSNLDDMETAYKNVVFLMNAGTMRYIVEIMRSSRFGMESTADFVKGYYANYFMTILRELHVKNGNKLEDDMEKVGMYVRKIGDSWRLKNLIDEIKN